MAARVLSGSVAAVACTWLIRRDSYPDHLRADDTGSLVALVDPTVTSVTLLVLGLLGLGLGFAFDSPSRRPGRRAVAAAFLAVVFTLVLTDLTLLVTFGYSSALLGPPAVFLLLIRAAIGRPALRWLVAALVIIFLGGALAMGADSAATADFTRELGSGLRRSGEAMLLNVAAFATGMTWGALAFTAPGVSWWGDRPASASYVKPRHGWGWWATLVAALCPLPYAALRMTWLTPWPALTNGADLDADPAIRIFGLCLGLAAMGGAVLTLGLLARWGTVYPRWVPGLGGRPVSPGWPTATAIGVGLALTVAGRAFVQILLGDPDFELPAAELFLVFPFPVWGPALLIAAVAYHRRRHPVSCADGAAGR